MPIYIALILFVIFFSILGMAMIKHFKLFKNGSEDNEEGEIKLF